MFGDSKIFFENNYFQHSIEIHDYSDDLEKNTSSLQVTTHLTFIKLLRHCPTTSRTTMFSMIKLIAFLIDIKYQNEITSMIHFFEEIIDQDMWTGDSGCKTES